MPQWPEVIFRNPSEWLDVSFIMTSETPPETIYSGTAPGVTLYYLAHVETFETPPVGSWRDNQELMDRGAVFLHNFDEGRPETGLRFLDINSFINQDVGALSELARQLGGSVRKDSLFGTSSYIQYALPAGPWPGVLGGGEFWDVQTDGVHLLAALRLPQLDPSDLQGSPFPHQLYDQLQAQLPEWNLEFEQLIFGLNWHSYPASRFPLAGQVFCIQDVPMIASKDVPIGTVLTRYVGQDCDTYLPLYLGDYLALSVRTRRLTTLVDEAMRVRVGDDRLFLSEQLGTVQDREAQRTQLVQMWNQLLELKKQFDAQEDLIRIGQAWREILKALKKYGFYRKPTGNMILHGPYQGVLFRNEKGYELRVKEIPRVLESVVSTKKLERLLKNAERYRHRLNEQFTLVKESLNIQSSLLSLGASEQSLKTANNSYFAAIVSLIIALVALGASVWFYIHPVDSSASKSLPENEAPFFFAPGQSFVSAPCVDRP